MVKHMLVHDGEQFLKAQLEKLTNTIIIYLQAKVTMNHKEMISHQKKLKPILKGMDKEK